MTIKPTVEVGPATCKAAADLARSAVDTLTAERIELAADLARSAVDTLTAERIELATGASGAAPAPAQLVEAARMLRAAANLVDPPHPGVRRGGVLNQRTDERS